MVDRMTKMTLNQYQLQALRTSKRDWEDSWDRVGYLALGLSDESGEISKLVKRRLRDGVIPTQEEMAGEIGDALWYLANLADAFGLSFGEIARGNIEKLRERYPEGFRERRYDT